MAKNNDIGKLGEDIATFFLQKSENWTILERNWRYKRAEIDIIAKEKEVLVFVEVKTRSYTYKGNQPEDYVTPAKETLMMAAAGAYMDKINYDWEVRFDIISILLQENGEPKIEHFKDAFF